MHRGNNMAPTPKSELMSNMRRKRKDCGLVNFSIEGITKEKKRVLQEISDDFKSEGERIIEEFDITKSIK